MHIKHLKQYLTYVSASIIILLLILPFLVVKKIIFKEVFFKLFLLRATVRNRFYIANQMQKLPM